MLITGHTGFKGAWLTIWLHALGAHVAGFALAPEERSLFIDAGLARICDHVIGDVRDQGAVAGALRRTDPDVIFHLAAQALVRRGHLDPTGTFATNITGTVDLLEAVRARGRPCAVVAVTSDKCYRPSGRPHVEDDALGGDDPYSASKAACELVVAAYRSSYFAPARIQDHGVALATARAGNVIGGGDRAEDRIVPDVVRALEAGSPVVIRNPEHVRPWQHVLEPLAGYLILGAGLAGWAQADRADLCEAWNFGPDASAERTVMELVEAFLARWGGGTWVLGASGRGESPHLRLDASKARQRLGWTPRWDFPTSVARTADWYKEQAATGRTRDLRALCIDQIDDYLRTAIPA